MIFTQKLCFSNRKVGRLRMVKIGGKTETAAKISITKNHVGARHCRKPLGRSVRQSFNKQELSNFYQFGYSTAFV